MSDKVILVIGGESFFGFDAALNMVSLGHTVGVLGDCKNIDSLQNQIFSYRVSGSRHEPADVAAFYDGAIKKFGKVDGVLMAIEPPY